MDGTRERALQDPDVVTADEFRTMMAGWPTGVAVVTSAAGEQPVGCTVNALATVSLKPPSVVVAFGRGSATLAAVREHGLFGVNVLSHRDWEIGHRFAHAARDERFTGVAYTWTMSVPLLDVAQLRSVYRLEHWLPVSDHVLVVGRLVVAVISEATLEPPAGPAIRYQRAYWRLCGLDNGSD